MNALLGALTRPEALASLLTSSAFFKLERSQSNTLHRQGLRTSVVQHAREVRVESTNTCVSSFACKLHIPTQIVVEHLNAARENLRDTVGLENEKVSVFSLLNCPARLHASPRHFFAMSCADSNLDGGASNHVSM